MGRIPHQGAGKRIAKPKGETPAPWTDEQLKRLAELHASGASGSEMANTLSSEFKVTRTRNAVIGKLHRLGLFEEDKGKQAENRIRNTARVKNPYGQRARSLGQRMKFEAKAEAPPAEGRKPGVRMTSQGYAIDGKPATAVNEDAFVCDSPSVIPLIEAGPNQCKWPASPDLNNMDCCGKPVQMGAYCAEHARKGYREPPTKGRQMRFNKKQTEWQHH